MISVTILGAGNVATHLFKAFNKAENIAVKQWYNRTISKLNPYKSQVDIISKLENLTEANIYILAVSDDAVARLSRKLPFKNKMVVHTSGSVAMHDLDKKNKRGVFYPLQTFSKATEVNFTQIPICLEVDAKNDITLLNNLAEAIGSKHYRVNSEQRSALHLAAVFVNNFTNQLYRVAHEITEAHQVDFNILKPLIKETANKIEKLSPFMAQTGPAKRNDTKTLEKHLNLLEKKQHKDLYNLLTKAIQETHGKKL